jgi:hypothetical protein
MFRLIYAYPILVAIVTALVAYLTGRLLMGSIKATKKPPSIKMAAPTEVEMNKLISRLNDQCEVGVADNDLALLVTFTDPAKLAYSETRQALLKLGLAGVLFALLERHNGADEASVSILTAIKNLATLDQVSAVCY